MAPLLRPFVLVFACLLSNNVWAGECGAGQVKSCFGGAIGKGIAFFTDAKFESGFDLEGFCSMMECAGTLQKQCDLPVGVAKLVDKDFAEHADECRGPCSFKTYQNCLGGLDKTTLKTKEVKPRTPKEIEKYCLGLGCFKASLVACRGVMKTRFESMIQLLALRCQGGACTLKEYKDCTSAMDITAMTTMKMGKQPTPEQLKKYCSGLGCFEAMSAQCKGNMANEVQTVTKNVGSMCGGPCSHMAYMDCMGMGGAMKEGEATPDDAKDSCQTLSCLKKLMPYCADHVKMAVQTNLQKMAPMCPNGCSNMVGIMKCTHGMIDSKQLESRSLNNDSCKEPVKVQQCIGALEIDSCDGFTPGMKKNKLQESINFQCCSSIVKAIGCYPDKNPVKFHERHQNAVFDINGCLDMEKVYACILQLEMLCDTPMLKESDQVQRELRVKLVECELKGYDPTVSLTDGTPLGKKKGKDSDSKGGRGRLSVAVAVQPTLSVLFGLVFAVVTMWF